MNTTTTDRNKVLAELMGWRHHHVHLVWEKGEKWRKNVPKYDTDYNAMAEVWKVLKEKGLWDGFIAAYSGDNGFYIYDLLTDLTGQVEAAITVLEGDDG